MQRALAFLVSFLSLLYLAGGTLATRNAGAQEQRPAGEYRPHLAVLLPLKSPALGRLADAVRKGVLEAARVQPNPALPTIIYATGDDPFDVMQAYELAVRAGARMVIGPLTRTAVSALASSNLITIPTLALNAPEVDVPLPSNMYLFGLQVENEARQIAQIAAAQGRRRALIVVSDSPLSKRLSDAFRAEWTQRGNSVEDEFQYTTDVASLSKLRDTLAVGTADMVFLALEAKRAKLIRSYLGLSMPVYATSMVHTSSAALANFELNGVYFVDMPWLLTPDHPAVLIYERPDPSQVNMEYERFYALGIDAYRLTQSLLKPLPDYQPLDGVTGYITVDPEHRLTRELIPAQFVQGDTKVLSDLLPR